MDENRWEGKGRQIKGEAKDVIGKVTGDTGMQIEGKVDKVTGKAQDVYGRAKDNVKDGVERLGDGGGGGRRKDPLRDPQPRDNPDL